MATKVYETPVDELERALAGAAAAAAPLAGMARCTRAGALRGTADALDAAAEELVGVAADETSLSRERLVAEMRRTTGQLRMFADGLEEGAWLDIFIDTADPQAHPVPTPDLRRMQLPVGPVLVFAASNFPFAFSVAGGDTASALATGCPVIVKAHPGHPRTSVGVASALTDAITDAGLPAGSFALVHGQEAGVAALRDPRICAASFTGSLHGGRALFDIAADRDVPIPFYAEMGSLNPVFVSPGALAARAESVVEGYVASFTLGAGQFCTKPGLLFLPRGHGLTGRLVEALRAVPPARMLLERIHAGHRAVRDVLTARPGIATLFRPEPENYDPVAVAPTLLATDVGALLADSEAVLTECFGPTSIVVEYDDVDDAVAAARELPGSLTATVHAEASETEFADRLTRELSQHAGRLVFNGWPTGVSVSWAMHHGGPYPATSLPAYTSVGITAAQRFVRPVCYQDCPQELLPEVLRNGNTAHVPRRVNGRLSTDDVVHT